MTSSPPKTWNAERAANRIDTRLTEVKQVTIYPYTRRKDLDAIQVNQAYALNGAHLYFDITNIDQFVGHNRDDEEAHRKLIIFTDRLARLAHRVINSVDAIRVDSQNQRLHSVVAEPYGDDAKAERGRVAKAVGIAAIMATVLLRTGHQSLGFPPPSIRAGIDTGLALAVRNGRPGAREPLFLGWPANLAAKLASDRRHRGVGIFLTNTARAAVGLMPVENPANTSLSLNEVQLLAREANISFDEGRIIREWEKDLADNPPGDVRFSRAALPLSSLDVDQLSASNVKRMDAVAAYADIDGFTKFVGAGIQHAEAAKNVVRTLHIIRSEIDAVWVQDFGGAHIRFIGDCLHGVLAEGSTQVTDPAKSVEMAVTAAAAMESSFQLCIKKLAENGIDATSLGLQVGLEFGPMTICRIGLKGDLVPCSMSHGQMVSEDAQADCLAWETASGFTGYGHMSPVLKRIFHMRRSSSMAGKTGGYDRLLGSFAISQGPSVLVRTAAGGALAAAAASPARAFGSTPWPTKR
ncbi:MAG: transcriptional regulator [Proteobacteria bacterium]|nr:transcriptional regulator [Pseudomonadota bacterium]